MIFPGKIRINQYVKVFYVCLFVKGDNLISVIIKHLEDDFMIKFLLIIYEDERFQSSTFYYLKLAYWPLTIPRLYLIRH